MTDEQQEMLYAALVARDSGFARVEIAPQDLVDLFNEMSAARGDAMRNFGELEQARERIAQLEARVEEMRRKHEPTMAEQGDNMDAMAGMCWG